MPYVSVYDTQIKPASIQSPIPRATSRVPLAAVSMPYYARGCYNDFIGGWRMLPLLLSSSGVNGIGVNSSCMTVELCAYIARNQGFDYFGVEAGTSAHGWNGESDACMQKRGCWQASWLLRPHI